MGVLDAPGVSRKQVLLDLTRRRINVGAKARHLGFSGLSNGTDTGFNVRLRMTSLIDVHGLVASFGNFYNNGGSETPGPNDITIRAAIEFNSIGPAVGALVFWPLTFGGKRDVTINPGGIVETDYSGIDLPAGANWWLRIYGTVSAGGKWPLGPLGLVSSSDGAASGTTQTDLTTSGTVTALSTDTFLYGPLGLYTSRRDRTPFVAVVGDSIPNGSGDAPVQDNGFAVRALRAVSTPYTLLSVPGSQSATFTSYAAQYRLAQIRDCTSVLWAYGANDLQALHSLSTMQTDALTGWKLCYGLGQPVWACTITPNAASTDSWATTGNQTIHQANPQRVQFNDWLRAGAPIDPTAKTAVAVGTSGALVAGQGGHYLSGVFETADVVESARNSGRWKATGTANYATADGLHPSSAMHQAMSAVINTAKFAF